MCSPAGVAPRLVSSEGGQVKIKHGREEFARLAMQPPGGYLVPAPESHQRLPEGSVRRTSLQGHEQGRATCIPQLASMVMPGYQSEQRIRSTNGQWLAWELGDSLPQQMLTVGSQFPLLPVLGLVSSLLMRSFLCH